MLLKNQPPVENEGAGPSFHDNADSANNEEEYVGEQANEEHRGTESANQNQMILEQMKIMQQQFQTLLSGSNLRVAQQVSNMNWQYPCPSDSMYNPYFSQHSNHYGMPYRNTGMGNGKPLPLNSHAFQSPAITTSATRGQGINR